jgi:hypothetical protein
MIFFVTQSATEKSQRTTEVILSVTLCGLCVSLCNYSFLNKKQKYLTYFCFIKK